MSKMSDAALAQDATFANRLPVAEIHLDHEFNHRGVFAAHECLELASDIAARGLLNPIIVRPVRPTDTNTVRETKKYVVIAGHRRLTAYRINAAELIPAQVKDVDEFEAHDINAVENLQRKELTVMQEAAAIKHYWLAQWTRDEIADRIHKSPGWVQMRCQLLDMPVEVQQLVSQGYLKLTDIRELYKYRAEPKRLLEMAGLMKAKRKGDPEVDNVLKRIRKPDKASSRKLRTRSDIFELQAQIQDVLAECDDSVSVDATELIYDGFNNLATKVLAWAAGEIMALDVHVALRKYAANFGVIYHLPDFTPEDV